MFVLQNLSKPRGKRAPRVNPNPMPLKPTRKRARKSVIAKPKRRPHTPESFSAKYTFNRNADAVYLSLCSGEKVNPRVYKADELFVGVDRFDSKLSIDESIDNLFG